MIDPRGLPPKVPGRPGRRSRGSSTPSRASGGGRPCRLPPGDFPPRRRDGGSWARLDRHLLAATHGACRRLDGPRHPAASANRWSRRGSFARRAFQVMSPRGECLGLTDRLFRQQRDEKLAVQPCDRALALVLRKMSKLCQRPQTLEDVFQLPSQTIPCQNVAGRRVGFEQGGEHDHVAGELRRRAPRSADPRAPFREAVRLRCAGPPRGISRSRTRVLRPSRLRCGPSPPPASSLRRRRG